MQTIYIDVYFLINFSVDLLSLHLASLFSKVKVSPFGMILSALFGGLYAVILIFLNQSIVYYLFVSVLFFLSILLFCARGCRWSRKIKFLASFLVMEILIGGVVYFLYGIIERSFEEGILNEIKIDRNRLILALLVLLAIVFLKLILRLFNNNFSEKSVKLKLIIWGCEYFVEALVDSGNFLKDPMDLSPVMLVKERFYKKIFPHGAPGVSSMDTVAEKIKKHIRLIPMTSSGDVKILCGLRPDDVFVFSSGKYEKINLIIAFDEEGGSYAGFDGLIPNSVLENL